MKILMDVVWTAICSVILMLLIVAGAHGASAAEVDQIELPYPEALECFGIKKVEKVGQYTASRHGQPVFVMLLDSNEDGKHDVMLVFNLHKQDGDLYVSIAPSYIALDDDFNGAPDRAYEIQAADEFSCDLLKKISLDTLLRDHTGV